MSSRRRRSFVAAGDPFKGPPHMEEVEEEEEAWQDGPRGNNGTVEYYLNCTNIQRAGFLGDTIANGMQEVGATNVSEDFIY